MSWRSLQLVLLFLALNSRPVAATEPNLEFFEKKIRPLLIDNCFECHSTDKKIKGGLLLDSREGWMKGGDSGPAIVPGDPEQSRLIKAVRYDDPDLQMPPKRRLSAEQVADLERWIKSGAPDPRSSAEAATARQTGLSVEEGRKFWAYQPLKNTKPPVPINTTWPRTEIDRFVMAGMEAKQLQPASDSDRSALARRVYFDLIGLPPSPEQLDAFVKDKSPDAYKRLIDQLLTSPRFGEHWARHWLDVARYAESVTLRGLIFKEAWRYRDYVIEAFNRDLPYDQFVREQIAGDLLPGKTLEDRRRQVVATTFLMLGNSNLEEQDKKQLEMDVVDEQLDTLGKAFLAQTIGCARCHDHKFDPIPTRDYYAMAGILKNATALKHANVSTWVEVPMPVDAAEEIALKQHEAAVSALEKKIVGLKQEARKQAGQSGEPKPSDARPEIVAAGDIPGVVVDSAQARTVGSWKLSQYSKRYIGDGYLHDENSGKGEKTLTFLPDLKTPGRYEVRLAYVHSPGRSDMVPVTIFHADGETTVHINQKEAPTLESRFASLGQYRFEANGFGHVLVSTEGTQGHVTADAVQFLPAEAGSGTEAKDKNAPNAVAGASATQTTTALKALEEEMKTLRSTGPKRPMVMSVKENTNCQDVAVHIRGSVHNLGPVVPRGFLTVANTSGLSPPISHDTSGRLELAGWITDPANPLTARVIVNRVWHWLMGEGLVRTVDNFGTTGEKPSHPELLDYLAQRFVQQGWSVKTLIREIMLSRVYQMSTVPHAQNGDADPENRLLTHMNRRRLAAECLRDGMLAVSGELKLESGGRTFPESRTADYGFDYTDTRRSIYIPIFRNALPDILEAFDFAPPSMVVGHRETSTIGSQALFMLNHPFVRDRAEAAARRLLQEAASDDGMRLDIACRATLGRSPHPNEARVLLEHIRVAREKGESPIQTWTKVMHALFASLDFRYLN